MVAIIMAFQYGDSWLKSLVQLECEKLHFVYEIDNYIEVTSAI
jgi:hypothetical protein